MTKNEIITKFKKDFPSLTKGEDDQVITLTAEEYEATIEKWADAELERQAKELAEQQAKADKQALLAKLGITADEAKLLLS